MHTRIDKLKILLENSRTILLAPGEDNVLDTLPAALGIAWALRVRGLAPTIFFSSSLPAELQSLDFQTFLSREIPEQQYISGNESYGFDCLITIGVSSLGRLESLGAAPADFFFTTPIINIDINPENEQYGILAFVDPAFGTMAEFCAHILKRLWPGALPSRAATAFLGGTLLGTDAFRASSDAHRTMLASARLLTEGGEYRQLVQHVYKTKPAPLIRLMGKILLRAEWKKSIRLMTSYLTWRDIHEEHASPSLLPRIMHDICRMWPHARYVLVAWEDIAPCMQAPSHIRALIRGGQGHTIHELWQELGGIKKKNYLALATIAHSSKEAMLRIEQAIESR